MDSLNVLEKLAEHISSELLALVAIALVLLTVVAKNLIPDSDRKLKQKILLYTYAVNGSVILICLVIYIGKGCNGNFDRPGSDSCVVTVVVPVDLRKGTVFLNDQETHAEPTSEGFKIRVNKNARATIQVRRLGYASSRTVSITANSDTSIILSNLEPPPPLEFCEVTLVVPVDLRDGIVFLNDRATEAEPTSEGFKIRVRKNTPVTIQVKREGYLPSKKVPVNTKSDTTLHLTN